MTNEQCACGNRGVAGIGVVAAYGDRAGRVAHDNVACAATDRAGKLRRARTREKQRASVGNGRRARVVVVAAAAEHERRVVANGKRAAAGKCVRVRHCAALGEDTAVGVGKVVVVDIASAKAVVTRSVNVEAVNGDIGGDRGAVAAGSIPVGTHGETVAGRGSRERHEHRVRAVTKSRVHAVNRDVGTRSAVVYGEYVCATAPEFYALVEPGGSGVKVHRPPKSERVANPQPGAQRTGGIVILAVLGSEDTECRRPDARSAHPVVRRVADKLA